MSLSANQHKDNCSARTKTLHNTHTHTHMLQSVCEKSNSFRKFDMFLLKWEVQIQIKATLSFFLKAKSLCFISYPVESAFELMPRGRRFKALKPKTEIRQLFYFHSNQKAGSEEKRQKTVSVHLIVLMLQCHLLMMFLSNAVCHLLPW